MMSRPILLLALALAWLTSCLPEQQMARLLDRHPSLLSQLAPSIVRDSTVTQLRDTVLTVRANGAVHQVHALLHDVTHYRTTQATLVLDNARSRRLLADSRNRVKLLTDQLHAQQQENDRLHGLAYPRWYGSIWFWVAALLFVLLVLSVVLRFARFSFLPF